MENPTQFDLEASLRSWCDELAAQPGLTPETRKELENHLCDTIAELRERGLNPEEAFWLARRRTGLPQAVGEEFAKADPSAGWRSRALWAATALLAVWMIQGVFSGISGLLGVYESQHLTYFGSVESTIPQTRYPRSVANAVVEPRHLQRPPFHQNYAVVELAAPPNPQTLRHLRAVFGPHNWEVRNDTPWWVDGLRDALQDSGIGGVIAAMTVVCFTAFLARAQPDAFGRVRRLLFDSRLRFALIAILLVVAILIVEQWSAGANLALMMVNPDWPLQLPWPGRDNSLPNGFPLALAALIVLLIPSRRKNSMSNLSSVGRSKNA